MWRTSQPYALNLISTSSVKEHAVSPSMVMSAGARRDVSRGCFCNRRGLTVVVVDGDQVAELQVAGERGSLASDTLLETPVTGEHCGARLRGRREEIQTAKAH